MPVFRHMESIDLDALTPAQRKRIKKLKREKDKEEAKYRAAYERFAKISPIYSMLRVMCPLTHLGAKEKAEQIYADLQKLAPKPPKGDCIPHYVGVDAYAGAAKSLFPAKKSAKSKRQAGMVAALGAGYGLTKKT